MSFTLEQRSVLMASLTTICCVFFLVFIFFTKWVIEFHYFYLHETVLLSIFSNFCMSDGKANGDLLSSSVRTLM